MAIMCSSDHRFRQTLHIFPDFLPRPGRSALQLLAFVSCLASCESPQTDPAAVADGCADGRLKVELYGALQTTLDWQGEALACEGMPRPDGAGARLRFAGPGQSGSAKRSLVFIFGLPGLERDATGKELPTNVTFMEEGTGRFFATQDTNSCWTDIARHTAIGDATDARYTISGVMYCVSPLAELNGTASVNFAELHFSGQLDWSAPE